MSPEQTERIHQLPFLIDNEKDLDKLKAFAAELESRLVLQLNEYKLRV